MNSVSIVSLCYKRVLKEARAMFPDCNEQTALWGYVNIQAAIIGAALLNADNDRAFNALRDKVLAIELYLIFGERKN